MKLKIFYTVLFFVFGSKVFCQEETGACYIKILHNGKVTRSYCVQTDVYNCGAIGKQERDFASKNSNREIEVKPSFSPNGTCSF